MRRARSPIVTNTQEKKELEAVSAAKRALQSDIQKLTKNQEKLNAERLALESTIQYLQNKAEKWLTDLDALKAREKQAVEENKTRLDTLKQEEQLAKEKTTEAILELQKTRDVLSKINDDHSFQLQRNDALLYENHEVTLQVVSLKYGREQISSEIAKLSEQKTDLLNTIKIHGERINTLNQEILVSRDTISKLESDHVSLDQKNKALLLDNDLLSKQLKNNKSTLATILEHIAEAEKELKDREIEIADISLRAQKNDKIAHELEAAAKKLGRNVKLT